VGESFEKLYEQWATDLAKNVGSEKNLSVAAFMNQIRAGLRHPRDERAHIVPTWDETSRIKTTLLNIRR